MKTHSKRITRDYLFLPLRETTGIGWLPYNVVFKKFNFIVTYKKTLKKTCCQKAQEIGYNVFGIYYFSSLVPDLFKSWPQC